MADSRSSPADRAPRRPRVAALPAAVRAGVIRLLPWIPRPSGRGGNGTSLRGRSGVAGSPSRRTGFPRDPARLVPNYRAIFVNVTSRVKRAYKFRFYPTAQQAELLSR
ncbi:helix-turn-helix domain-containing protein, partial [Micromonospora sp. NPDC047620]|uniref:helix-turn-helix domain-containing protein n=1 Tax=Micromonospora sp. NPDC047620 TaxID=3364251 RepID=UPI0037208070